MQSKQSIDYLPPGIDSSSTGMDQTDHIRKSTAEYETKTARRTRRN
jgi:hypothetical protein